VRTAKPINAEISPPWNSRIFSLSRQPPLAVDVPGALAFLARLFGFGGDASLQPFDELPAAIQHRITIATSFKKWKGWSSRLMARFRMNGRKVLGWSKDVEIFCAPVRWPCTIKSTRIIPPMQLQLLHLKDVKLLAVCGGVGDVGGQIAAAVEIARQIGLPLAQRQCEVGALQ
jgi:hypothetical protein